MKTVNFKGENELIDNLLEVFEESDDITLVVNRELANIFLDEYYEDEFDFYGISMTNDTDIYYITKIEDIHFSITETKYRGEYKPDESAKVIILKDVYDREILDYIKTDDIEIYGIESIYNDLDFKLEHSNEGTCCGDCSNCYYDEFKEENLSEFAKLNDVQKDYLFTKLSDMEDINLNEIAKICLTFYDDGVNSTLLKTRLLLSELEK